MSSSKDTFDSHMTIVTPMNHTQVDEGGKTIFFEKSMIFENDHEEVPESSSHSFPLAEEMTKEHLERYVTRSLLGTGGFALVHQVTDAKIGRDVAVKRLNTDASETMRNNFLLEARVMSQLDHPGILPVYDFLMETDDDGQLTFAYSMRIATHKSLYEYLVAHGQNDYHKICNILHQVALTLEHAHQRSILHRDIKPPNILLGSEGEVYLTDWGVCTLLPSHPDYECLSDKMKSFLVGTPGFMAPEQVYGVHDKMTPLADVYGLGATLYYALTGVPVHMGVDVLEVLEAVKEGKVTPPSEVWLNRGQEFPYPQLLESICLKALSLDPQDRYQSAREFADVLERFTNGELEKERARESAEIAYRLGQGHLASFIESFDYQSLLSKRVDTARANYKKYRTRELRATLWELENQLDDLLNPMEASFAHAISAFQSALRDDPDHEGANKSITQLYKVRYQQALEANDQQMSFFFAERIKEYATPQELLEFDKPSEIRLAHLPRGTTVRVLESHLKRYANPLTEERVIEHYNDEVIFLKRGRYVITCSHPEASETRIVLWIKKYQRLVINTPLPKKSSIPEGFVYTKDRLAFGRYPVTVSEYYGFLNDLSLESAAEHIPRYHQTAYCERAESGRFEAPYTDLEGDTWYPDFPVFLVSYDDASAYAEWCSHQLSAHVRLPTEREWTEAASGSDGRPYPWGTSFDASLCVMRETHEGRPMPRSVNSAEADRSPYGVCCVAGSICQWVSTQADGVSNRKKILGGSYNSMELMCHLRQQMQGNAHETFVHVGIRVLIELTDDDFLPY